MKSPISVESDHWQSFPRSDVLRNEMAGVSGAREARMSLLRWERGWDGWRRKMVAGGDVLRYVACLLVGESLPKGMESLNRCDDVGDNFPGGCWELSTKYHDSILEPSLFHLQYYQGHQLLPLATSQWMKPLKQIENAARSHFQWMRHYHRRKNESWSVLMNLTSTCGRSFYRH